MNAVKPLGSSLYGRLMALPENLTGEIVDGELYTLPRPSGRHSVAESAMGATLLPPFQRGKGGPGGWWILDEPEVHFVFDTAVDRAGFGRLAARALAESPRRPPF